MMSNSQQSFSKAEKITNKNIIQRLFDEGKKINSKNFDVRILSGFENNFNQILITVSKSKIKSAVKRNLVKIWYITKHDYYLPLRKETIQN